MYCWKCANALSPSQSDIICDICLKDEDVYPQLKSKLDRLVLKNRSIENDLSSLLLKIRNSKKSANVDRRSTLDRCTHYLCLMIDELTEKVNVNTEFSSVEIGECLEKTLELLTLLNLLEKK